MKLVTFEHQTSEHHTARHQHAGVLSDSNVVSLSSAGFPTVLSVLEGGAEALRAVEAAIKNPAPGTVMPLDSVKLCAPIPRPPKIICIGLNYRDHAIESNLPLPTKPIVFSKYTTSVVGPGDDVVLPKLSEKPDYEAELAVVIGTKCKNVKAEDWKSVVFGYMNLNDVSARDIQLGSSQWMMGKTFDTFCPMGPYLVSADEIADPHNLSISITVGGEMLQNSNTKELIFDIPALLVYLSSMMTLEPGDVISTGTPAGVGLGFNPPKWLKPGQEMVVKIEGLGELKNTCVAEA